jgi:hypothetical protein
MKILVDCKAILGLKREVIIKELPEAGKDIIQTYHFKSLYVMNQKISDNNVNSKNGLH